MGIIFIGGIVLALVGLVGILANILVPAWQPRGPRKRAAITRLVGFGVALVVGVAIAVVVADLGTTITVIN